MKNLGFDLNIMALTAPIHRPALNGPLDTVKKLIELGADPTVRDTMYGGNAMGWAEHGGQQAVIDYLKTVMD